MAKITRRQFLKYSAIAGASTVLPWKIAMREAYAQYCAGCNSPNLQKFIQPLRSIGGIAGVFNAGLQEAIPVAAPDPGLGGTRNWGTVSATHYTIDIRQFTDQLHPSLPATTLWGFHPGNVLAGSTTQMHLGGVIATGRNVPVQITFRNRLTSNGTPGGVPLSHIIPVDTSIPGPNQQQNRTAVHIHGGYVPWISDGGPFDWWMPDGQHGLSFLNNKVLRPEEFVAGTIPPNEAEYYYPNDQSARLIWYHDHAWGITRINAYAGIASGYVITDTVEAGLGVPGPLDARTFYMVFQDKVFNADGSLFYANIYDPLLFGPPGIPSFTGGAGGTAQTPLPTPSVVPEFFGDTILVNGTVYPYIEVQPQTYRFRMLNACNSRFLNPRLFYALSNTIGTVNSTEPNLNLPGPTFTQIGTEGGFLPAPVLLKATNPARRALMAPAERADMIVDFSAVPVGSVLILYSNAAGPFPGGSKLFDYYPGNTKTPTSIPGFGPNTRTLLQIRVVAGTPQPAPIYTLQPDPTLLVTQTAGVPIRPVINRTTGTASVPGYTNVKFRSLTLNEGFDEHGRLAQYIGTNTPTNAIVPSAVAGFYGQRYTDEAATEVPLAGAVEIWEIANLSADTHPLHFHLVNVQILARQAINVGAYNGLPTFRGKAVAPDDIELGWKETVRMNPAEVIWVIMKFDLPPVPFAVPTSPRAGAGTTAEPGFGNVVPAGATANEYVWHCHILEHEEHDMMRPVVVVGDNPTNGVQVRPTTATVTANSGTAQIVKFTIFGGKPPYSISPSTFAPTLDASIRQVVTLTVPANTPASAGPVVYTINDSTTPTPGSALFTLNIQQPV